MVTYLPLFQMPCLETLCQKCRVWRPASNFGDVAETVTITAMQDTRGTTVAHLNACMWEFHSRGGGGGGGDSDALPERVKQELASLPPAALHAMVRTISLAQSCT